MKKMSVLPFVLLIASTVSFAQQSIPSKLKVFIDCSNTWCDMQYIRSAINIVDFLLDNAAADVHVLITSQSTGSGGDQYQLIFFGQQSFKNQTDTLRFSTDPNATEFEERELLLKYLKTGLIPFIAKTAAMKNIEISLKTTDTTAAGTTDSTHTKDPWNAWVLRIGADGNMNADANYKNANYSGNFSANRITDKLKTGIAVNWGENKSTFAYEENGTIEKFVVNNHNWSINQYLVKSINTHWSWATEIKYNQNTFSNNKGRALLRAGVEYNIFPYKEVNNKSFTLSYSLSARRNYYYDTTIYDKTKESLYGHRATASLSLNQKWGSSYAGITYHNYFNNWKFFNLGIDVYTNVRITGGLSFYIMAFGGLTRDQIFLVKGNTTPEEVLARRRQLASGYNYYSSIGINYRFGSKLNNVVNPRFNRIGSANED
ncbi:hypothetical protein [Lacibacter sp. H407]|uniref:hypothetical protein n=1 Tax=Lacibacter sp. H407 TaxID=3133423 RepID=UPI0030BB026F